MMDKLRSAGPVTLRPYQEIFEWDHFVELHPEGTISHTTAMMRCHSAAKLQTVFACSALDSAGLDPAGEGWEGENYGSGRFKSQFGGALNSIARYRKVYSPWKLLAAQKVYRSVRGWLAPPCTSLPSTTLK